MSLQLTNSVVERNRRGEIFYRIPGELFTIPLCDGAFLVLYLQEKLIKSYIRYEYYSKLSPQLLNITQDISRIGATAVYPVSPSIVAPICGILQSVEQLLEGAYDG